MPGNPNQAYENPGKDILFAGMKKQDWLFEIIRAMSKPEKAFFIKFCGLFSGGEPGYLALFKALERMSAYDEAVLQKKLEGKIAPARMPATRNYLKNMLLKSIHAFNNELSDDVQLSNMLFNIAFYHRKNLLALCEKEVAAAKKFALEHELYTRLHEVMRWERTILPVINPLNDETLQRIESGIAEEKENFVRIETDAAYYLRSIRLNKLLHRTDRSMDEPIEKTQAFHAFCSDVYYTDDTLAKTTGSRIIFCTMQFVTAYHRGEKDRAEYFLKRRIELMETNPHFLANRLMTYISTLYNYIIFISLKKDEALFTEQMNKFTAIPEVYKKRVDNIHIETIHVHSINAWLDFYIMLGKFEQITRMNIEFPASYATTNYLLTFYYSACLKTAAGYFATGDYKTALKYVNRIINDKTSRSFPERLLMGRILNLMIHYEMQHDAVIEYESQSLNYQLKKKDKPAAVETEVLLFISELQQNAGQKRTEKLAAIRNRILSLTGPADDKHNFFIFTWMDAKTQGISFLEAFRMI